MLRVPTVDTPNMVPNFAAARAMARSPSWWNRRCMAVGAKNSGMRSRVPSTSTDMSTESMPASTRGTRSTSSKAAVFRRRVDSSSEPPSM
jgi:hypothetical protein